MVHQRGMTVAAHPAPRNGKEIYRSLLSPLNVPLDDLLRPAGIFSQLWLLFRNQVDAQVGSGPVTVPAEVCAISGPGGPTTREQ